MNQAERPWPPLIYADLPPWMKWRDAALTLGMWILLGSLLVRQFRLAQATHQDVAYLSAYLTRLSPYVLMAILLIGLLVVAARFTERRRRRGSLVPEPAPLAPAVQARRAGMDDAALASARDMRIAVVHVDGSGRHRVVPS